jgi:hypothetical protein
MKDKSRRDFIRTGITTVAATAAIAGGLTVVISNEARAAGDVHPFGYPSPESGLQLDVEETRRLGYQGYKGITIDGVKHKHCGFATFNAIIGQLAEKVGGGYRYIPTQMMEWAAGGAAGFASLCGALNGACAAIGLICANADAKLFISDLLTWYSETPLPTNIVAPTGDLPQSVAGSNICHVSVTRWCLASGYASGSPERAERCARLAGDIAATAVDMLNNGILGLKTPGNATGCRVCHYKGATYENGQFTRGQMNCNTCHIETNMVSGIDHMRKPPRHKKKHHHEKD